MGTDRLPAAGVTLAELEALLFVAERPLGRAEIARLAGVPPAMVDGLIVELADTLAGRGLRVVVSGDRVELATAPETAPLVARYVGHEGPRLSTAALETLAIVAYRQPVTRSVIERIRGVDSDYVLRGLIHRRLVVEVGRASAPGRPYLFGTGLEFLERFGLTSLEELPVLDAATAAALEAGTGAAGEPEPEPEPEPVALTVPERER